MEAIDRLRHRLTLRASALVLALGLMQAVVGVIWARILWSSIVYFPDEGLRYHIYSRDGRDEALFVMALAAAVGGVAICAAVLAQKWIPQLARVTILAGSCAGFALSYWLWDFFVIVPTFVVALSASIALRSPFEDHSARIQNSPSDKLVL